MVAARSNALSKGVSHEAVHANPASISLPKALVAFPLTENRSIASISHLDKELPP